MASTYRGNESNNLALPTQGTHACCRPAALGIEVGNPAPARAAAGIAHSGTAEEQPAHHGSPRGSASGGSRRSRPSKAALQQPAPALPRPGYDAAAATELEYVRGAVLRAPASASAWGYMRALLQLPGGAEALVQDDRLPRLCCEVSPRDLCSMRHEHARDLFVHLHLPSHHPLPGVCLPSNRKEGTHSVPKVGSQQQSDKL